MLFPKTMAYKFITVSSLMQQDLHMKYELFELLSAEMSTHCTVFKASTEQ
jgi:hypothetical protein